MKRSSYLQIASAAVLLLVSTLAWSTDVSMLKPPKGSKVAIIAFEDLECPQCAKAAPMLHEAAKKYNIPLVQYDFPLRQHPWSYEAAVNARYFDTKSLKLGDDYRLYIFANQNSITSRTCAASPRSGRRTTGSRSHSSSIRRASSAPKLMPTGRWASVFRWTTLPQSTS